METEERGEPSIIAVRKSDRIQLLIVDKREAETRQMIFDISDERAFRLGLAFLNEVKL